MTSRSSESTMDYSWLWAKMGDDYQEVWNQPQQAQVRPSAAGGAALNAPMTRNPRGNTAVVASNATAAAAFLVRRRGAGRGEINKTGAHPPILPTILPQSLALFR